MKTKILLVEDDKNLGTILKDYLQVKGFDVTLAQDGDEGFSLFTSSKYDLCIFDVMMPKLDGFSLAEKVRKLDEEIPVIFLTAKSMPEDRITGLKIGADDYLTKPFQTEELLLRIGNILKRIRGKSKEREPLQTLFNLGKYKFDYNRRALIFKSEEKKLTAKEADLLRLLCLYKNQTLERSKALVNIWNDDSYFNSRSMDVYISKLRGYLKNDPKIEIVNLHGTGFKLIAGD